MMRIALRHQIRLVPEQSLDFVEVYTTLNQSRGEGMPHIVKPEVWNSGPGASLTKLPHQKTHLQEIAEGSLEHWPA